MLRWIFFKLVDVVTYLKSSTSEYVIKKKYDYIDGTSQIHYMYMNKPYIFIGKHSEFPPMHTPKFSIPIKSAHVNGTDMTQWVKMCSSHRNVIPDPKYLFYTTRWVLEYEKWFTFRLKSILIPNENNVLHVENILNQKHVLGKMLCHLD